MEIAICDDEKVFCKELQKELLQYGCDRSTDVDITIFSSGNDFLMSEKIFDLVFMDYKMNGYDGIQTVEQIRKRGGNETVIFISAYGNVVYDTFAVNTFRFLLKPLDINKLYKALDDYLITSRNDDILILKCNDKKWKIKYSDIIYAEANRKHTLIRTTNSTLDVAKCLSEIEALLPKNMFIRTHRSYVVNYRHIVNHNKDTILLGNGEKSTIGRKYYSEFKIGFQDYIKQHNYGNNHM